jgi:hypothetical protein
MSTLDRGTRRQLSQRAADIRLHCLRDASRRSTSAAQNSVGGSTANGDQETNASSTCAGYMKLDPIAWASEWTTATWMWAI